MENSRFRAVEKHKYFLFDGYWNKWI